MRKGFVATGLLVGCLAIVLGAQATRGTRDDDDLSLDRPSRSSQLQFEYQFGIGGGDDDRLVGQPPLLRSGDRFMVRVRSRENAHAYLFVSNSEGDFDLLVPEREDRVRESGSRRGDTAGSRSGAVVGPRWRVVPDEGARLRLDQHEGLERVYVVVSPEPVAEIERLADRRNDDAPTVSEAWLLDLRNAYPSQGVWTRERSESSIRVSHAGGRFRQLVAVEDLAFRHR